MSCRRVRSPQCWTETIKRYQNRSPEMAQVINELIELAKQMKAVHLRGEI